MSLPFRIFLIHFFFAFTRFIRFADNDTVFCLNILTAVQHKIELSSIARLQRKKATQFGVFFVFIYRNRIFFSFQIIRV